MFEVLSDKEIDTGLVAAAIYGYITQNPLL